MEPIYAFALGIVQGLTEWLPISSSGHLALLKAFMGLETSIPFDVVLHMGTLVAVCSYFRKDLLNLARALLRFDTGSEDFRTAALILVGTLPAALAGFFFDAFFESLFSSLHAVGAGFMVSAIALALSRLGKGEKNINTSRALIIGISQAAAIAPGVSRSGMTISSALLSGVERERAFRFSFLLSIPVTVGALVLELHGSPQLILDWAYVVGFITSAGVGFASIGIARRVVLSGGFYRFALYCGAAGLAVLAYSLA